MTIQLDFLDVCAQRHGGVATSVAANRSIAPDKASLRELILAQIRLMSPIGSTCEDVERNCGLSHQTASARISELLRDGLIEARGCRQTASGRMARVYFIVGEVA